MRGICYPFVPPRAFRWSPPLVCCEQCHDGRGGQASLQDLGSTLSDKHTQGGGAGPSADCIFDLLGNLLTGFRSHCTSFRSQQQGSRFPALPHCCQHSPFAFRITLVLTGGSRYLLVVSRCGSPVISDAEHLLLELWTICVSSSEESCPFLIGLFAFWVLRCRSSLYILDNNILLAT